MSHARGGRSRTGARRGANRSFAERIAAALTAAALVMSQALAYVGAWPSAEARAATVPDSITVGSVEPYPAGQMDGDRVNSHMFENTDGTIMYCADADADTPYAGQTFSGRRSGGIVLDYILYYGCGGTADTGEFSRAETQCAIWWEMMEQGDGANYTGYFKSKQAAAGGKRLWQRAQAEASAAGPYAGSTWIYGTLTSTQRVIGQTMRGGSLNLHKVSADPSVTGSNACYSLAGATYEVYDSPYAGSQGHVGTLTTGEDGWTGTLDDLTPGTYWVWERSASAGYGTCDGSDGARWVDGYWYHEVTVGVGSTATVTCAEPPLDDPIDFVAQKVDADGDPVDDADGQGDATTEGAQLTVRFYEGAYDSVDSLPSSPNRTWVIQTKKTGKKIRARLADDYKVSGDNWYATTSDGNAVLPLGTFTVRETKAPDGYEISDQETHLGQIVEDPSSPFGSSVKRIGSWSNKFDQQDAGAGLAIVDQVKRGGVRLAKVDHERDASVAQGDATLAGAEVTIYNRSEKAVYVDGTRFEPGEAVLTLTTASDGTAASAADALPYGTYEARETKAPTGYLLNTGWTQAFSIQQEGQVLDLADLPDDVMRGGVSLTKLDHDLAEAYAQGDATLAGAEVTVTSLSEGPVLVGGTWYGQGDVVATMVTGDDGSGMLDGTTLPFGTYELRESKAPSGYNPNDAWSQTIEVREDGAVVALDAGRTVSDDVVRGGVSVRKVDSEWGASDPQGDATLAGAEFQITNESAHDVVVDGTRYRTGEVVKTIASGDDGIASTDADSLPYGTYSIRETKAPTGYLLNEAWSQTFEVRAQGTVIDLTDDSTVVADQVARGDVAVRKVDRELGESLPLGAATLAGAELTITNDSGHAVRVDGVDYQPGEVVKTLVTDETGAAATTGGTLPFGTYTIRETKAPSGYNLNERWSRVAHVREDGVTVDLASDDDAVDDQVRRGDLKLVKADEDTQDRMAGVAFSLTSKTTGESHVLVTDENGMIDTSAVFSSHASSTNASDSALMGDGTVDSSKLDASAGVWFSGRTDRQTTPNDALGALPYDTYELRELRCDANAGHRLVSMTVRVSRPGYTLDLGTFDDKEVNLGTTLTYGDGEKVVPADSSVALTDEVRYENLAARATYSFRGELHAIDADGNDHGVVATSERQVTTRFQSDTVPVTFEGVDTSALGGMRLVAYEWVLDGDDVLASHTDASDEGQSVRVPRLGTTMAGDLDHESDASADTIRLTDTVSYENLEPGREYDVTGTLHYRNADGTDGGGVTDADGNAVTASTKVTPDSWSGTCEVTFEFAGVDLAGRTVVAFEDASRDGTRYCTHSDITDAGQSVSYPAVGTTATSVATGDHDAPLGGTQRVTDEVRLTNLTVGHEYAVSGTLHLVGEDGTDAGVAKDGEGNDSTASATFTAEAADQTVTLGFEVATDQLAGRDTVAFEELSRDGVRLGTHADITDAGQTVSVPDVHTTLADAATGAQDVQVPAKADEATGDGASDDGGATAGQPGGAQAPEGADGTQDAGGVAAKVALVDTVAYENLLAGREYAVTGTLHVRNADGTDAGTLKDAQGNDVAASATFTPEQPDGSVDVAFEVDPDLIPAGTTLVAFEDLSREGVTVATHADISDEGQTVRVIDLHTTATDARTGEHEVTQGMAKITDRVDYANLKPGQEYVVTGTLHVVAEDGTDAGTLKDAGGADVTGTATFTPEGPDGSVDVTFDVDLTQLPAGTKVVAFEDLAREGVTVATHADITDEDQTLVVTAPAPPASEYPNTGQTPWAPIAIAAGVVAVAVAAVVLARRARRRRRQAIEPEADATAAVPPVPDGVSETVPAEPAPTRPTRADVPPVTDPEVLAAIEAAKRMGYGEE